MISGIRECLFCNANVEIEQEIIIERLKKRVEANDANSIVFLGGCYFEGSYGLQQDYNKALELWTRAAELGSCMAHDTIGVSYYKGEGVEKDMKKAIHHYELAAMAGHYAARHNLGVMECNYGSLERAIKHWIILASAGDSDSMMAIEGLFERGHVQSDAYGLTLKAYNHSCKEMRSEAREAAAHYYCDEKVTRG